MTAAFLVFVGGGLGSLARFAVGRWIGPVAAGAFPWATFVVNVSGSFLIGAIAGYAERRAVSDAARSFLAIGVLGGYTTYSSFNAETIALHEARGPAVAGAYVLATTAACLAAGFSGAWVARTSSG